MYNWPENKLPKGPLSTDERSLMSNMLIKRAWPWIALSGFASVISAVPTADGDVDGLVALEELGDTDVIASAAVPCDKPSDIFLRMGIGCILVNDQPLCGYDYRNGPIRMTVKTNSAEFVFVGKSAASGKSPNTWAFLDLTVDWKCGIPLLMLEYNYDYKRLCLVDVKHQYSIITCLPYVPSRRPGDSTQVKNPYYLEPIPKVSDESESKGSA